MKKMALILSLIISTYIVNAQKVLISNGGVSLSYSSEFTNTMICGDNNFDQYKIIAYINNNSGHTINIGWSNVSYTYYCNGFNVSPCRQAFPTSATFGIWDNWANKSTAQSSFYVLVPSGKGLPEPDADIGSFSFVDVNVELPKPNPTVPKPNGSNNNQTSNPPKNNKPFIKVDQDDLRVNPVDPRIKANELKQQQEQEARDKQTQQNLINAEKQRQALQQQQQKQFAEDNKRKQDEYNSQQAAIQKQKTDALNKIKTDYDQKLETIESNRISTNKAIEDAFKTIQEGLKKDDDYNTNNSNQEPE